jgi:polyhydroxyalkanoate synthesis regulator phasin
VQNSRAREYVESVMKQADQGLNTISGKAMYELVRDRLELQDRYNDLMATKLQEALDRIEELERRLGETVAGPATDAADEEADGDD